MPLSSAVRNTAMTIGLTVVAAAAVAQQPPAARPALLFKEEWKQPPYSGTVNDENRRATQDAVTNPRLELKLYGADARNVGVYNYEGRAGSRGVSTEGDFLETELAFGGMRWFKLNPEKVVTRVDEIGFADLSPGGGHGVSGAFNLSTIELYAKAVPR